MAVTLLLRHLPGHRGSVCVRPGYYTTIDRSAANRLPGTTMYQLSINEGMDPGHGEQGTGASVDEAEEQPQAGHKQEEITGDEQRAEPGDQPDGDMGQGKHKRLDEQRFIGRSPPRFQPPLEQ